MLQLPLLGARAFQASSSRAFATLPSSASSSRSSLVRHLQQPRFRATHQTLGKRFASSGWAQAPASNFEAQGGWKKVLTAAGVFGGAGASPSPPRARRRGGFPHLSLRPRLTPVEPNALSPVVASNLILNRETREALAPWERSYLNSTFAYACVLLPWPAARRARLTCR